MYISKVITREDGSQYETFIWVSKTTQTEDQLRMQKAIDQKKKEAEITAAKSAKATTEPAKKYLTIFYESITYQLSPITTQGSPCR